jgi:hypothetical protein
LKLLDYARRAAVHAELAGTMETHRTNVSTDVVRNALKDVLEAIDRLARAGAGFEFSRKRRAVVEASSAQVATLARL